MRPRGRFFVVHVRRHRRSDEQRSLVRVVVGQFDADRQPLDDLDEVAGGVLRRQQGERLTGPHGEAGDAALELPAAAVHVHLAPHPLADAQVRQLRLFEVRVDPDFRERADGHQSLPRLDVVAGVHVPADHDAVDLADDVAIAEVQFGQFHVVPRLLAVRPWPEARKAPWEPDPEGSGRCSLCCRACETLPGPCSGVRSVDASGSPSWVTVSMHSPRAARTVEKVWFRSGGTSLRPLPFSGWTARPRETRVWAIASCAWTTVAAATRCDCARRSHSSTADGSTRQQRLGAFEIGLGPAENRLLAPQGGYLGPQQGDLGIDLFGGVLKLPALGAELGRQAAGLGFGRHQVRLRLADGGALQRQLHLERFLVELDEQIPLLHALVVVDQHLHHLAGYPRGHQGHVTVDVSVVGAHRVQCRADPRDQEVTAQPPARLAAPASSSHFR